MEGVIKIIKYLINHYNKVSAFNLQINAMLNNDQKKHKTFKVNLREYQMDVLRVTAMYGIKSEKDFIDMMNQRK